MIKFLPFACLLACLVLTPARAETPRTIDDCEKIQAADAYNQCLASFGPVAKEHNLSPVGAGKAPTAAKTSAMRGDDVTATTGKGIGKSRAARGRYYTRGRRAATAQRGGRKSMSFTVRHGRRR